MEADKDVEGWRKVLEAEDKDRRTRKTIQRRSLLKNNQVMRPILADTHGLSGFAWMKQSSKNTPTSRQRNKIPKK